MKRQRNQAILEAQLGYQFVRAELLQQALTHRTLLYTAQRAA